MFIITLIPVLSGLLPILPDTTRLFTLQLKIIPNPIIIVIRLTPFSIQVSLSLSTYSRGFFSGVVDLMYNICLNIQVVQKTYFDCIFKNNEPLYQNILSQEINLNSGLPSNKMVIFSLLPSFQLFFVGKFISKYLW